MRLLVDENIPRASMRRLREAGHDVTSASEVLPGRPDRDLLQQAMAGGEILVTFDRDFGALVFQHGAPPPKGIILLRFVPASPDEPADVLLSIFDEDTIQLQGHFTVVEADRLRQRVLPSR